VETPNDTLAEQPGARVLPDSGAAKVLYCVGRPGREQYLLPALRGCGFETDIGRALRRSLALGSCSNTTRWS